MSSAKEPLGYVIPRGLHAAPASDPRLKEWMEGDPREWLYSDYPYEFKNTFLEYGVAGCQKLMQRLWVPDGYGVVAAETSKQFSRSFDHGSDARTYAYSPPREGRL